MGSTSHSAPGAEPANTGALVLAGWDQGALLPALPEFFVYSSDHPVSKAARRDRARREMEGEELDGVHLHAVAAPRGEEWVVIASQVCDLAKPVDHEPRVDALRAFETTNPELLRVADQNSVKYFLLDPRRGLIADATFRVQLEKPVLALHRPMPGVPPEDLARRRRFARWLARRYDRPALPDDVVRAIGTPIRDLLKQLAEIDTDMRATLDLVEEVRIGGQWDESLLRFHILFLIAQEAEDSAPLALAPLVSRLTEELDPQEAVLTGWAARSRRYISLADAEATEPIFLARIVQ